MLASATAYGASPGEWERFLLSNISKLANSNIHPIKQSWQSLDVNEFCFVIMMLVQAFVLFAMHNMPLTVQVFG